ncbi:right-handed parallel beta-helix repeat-containing protein [Cupriavidus sp. WKF15]|uniref:right-handed parallel beta-helix repeat-containing protein n=1 Tax=Cupriavidus sp. WKF15 TaxID=3032282 RepID=UPI0023E15D43|nr:right-handed parallel beta-helix repeat-containing protein [Cupriavidus sp. WKF15]WER47333.1 right-handed parallel beta-helix repeat-containing protein [Cupriavidus sp. WKF15]
MSINYEPFPGKNIFRSWITASVLCVTALVQIEAYSATAEIVIRTNETSIHDEIRCPSFPVPKCIARLEEAVALIQRSEWQNRLGRDFSLVRLRLEPGKYRLMSALKLQWGGGPENKTSLEIIGSGSGTVLSGAVPIIGWRALDDSEAAGRLPESVRRHVKVASISGLGLNLSLKEPPRGSGLPIRPKLTELFYRNTVQPVAAWPNYGYARLDRPPQIPAEDRATFSVSGRQVLDWEGEPDLRAFGYWFWNWAAQTFPIGSRDPVANVMTLEGEGSPYGIRIGQRIRIENALHELDKPGEWYLARSLGRVYFWPPQTANDGEAEISVAESLLDISSARSLVVRDMLIEATRGDAITVRNSNDVVIKSVTIRNTGGRAVVIDGGIHCGVRDSLIEDSGEGGISLSGGNRQSLDPSGHFASKNVIRRFSRLVKTYRYAVSLSGVGQIAEDNTISDSSHTAVYFSGNDHWIRGNEIHNVVTEASDAGAIYTGRDYTARGTVIEHNFLHDIRSLSAEGDVKGIYLDDQASGIIIRGNTFKRVQNPVFIGGGRDNLVEDNIFIESSPAVSLDARGLNGQRKMTLDPNGQFQKGLDAVPYQSERYAERYPSLATIRNDDIGAPKYNVARRNRIISGVPYSVDKEARNGIDLEEFTEQGQRLKP